MLISSVYVVFVCTAGSTGFPLSWLQKFEDFPGHSFPGPCRKPAMFKYRDKQEPLTTYIVL